MGWLVKISIRVGLIIGRCWFLRGCLEPASRLGGRFEGCALYAVAVIFLIGPVLTRWLNRDIHFRKMGGQPGPSADF